MTTERLHVLVACEYSGAVRDAFKAQGHVAVSCDLLPSESPGLHHQGDVRDLLRPGWRWDLMIAHPPCQYLTSAGMHWTARGLRDPKHTEDALAFVEMLMNANVPRIALENPIGIISSRVRKPDQIIQPHEFGADASKATCLWLKGLPKLAPTQHIAPRIVNGKKRWANQTDSGQNKLPPHENRWKDRSRTYPGIAAAMAEQWGNT